MVEGRGGASPTGTICVVTRLLCPVFFLLCWSIRQNVIVCGRYRLLLLQIGSWFDAEPQSVCELMHTARIFGRQYLRTRVWPVSHQRHRASRNEKTAALLEPKGQGDTPILCQARQDANGFDQRQRIWAVKGKWISRNMFSIRSICSA